MQALGVAGSSGGLARAIALLSPQRSIVTYTRSDVDILLGRNVSVWPKVEPPCTRPERLPRARRPRVAAWRRPHSRRPATNGPQTPVGHANEFSAGTMCARCSSQETDRPASERARRKRDRQPAQSTSVAHKFSLFLSGCLRSFDSSVIQACLRSKPMIIGTWYPVPVPNRCAQPTQVRVHTPAPPRPAPQR